MHVRKLSTEDQPWLVFEFSPVLAGVARFNLSADWPLSQFFDKDLHTFSRGKKHLELSLNNFNFKIKI